MFIGGETMEIRCAECRAVVQIPDARVPPNSPFRLNCPQCKAKILANTKREPSLDARLDEKPHPSPSAAPPHRTDEADEALPDGPDYLTLDQPAALLCLNRQDSRGEVKTLLE